MITWDSPISSGIFINRPNRIIAYCEIDGKTEKCHVKNTGRRVELLTAFGILNGRFPTKEEIVNECIRAYFMQVYESYSSKADPNDMMLRMMEEVPS